MLACQQTSVCHAADAGERESMSTWSVDGQRSRIDDPVYRSFVVRSNTPVTSTYPPRRGEKNERPFRSLASKTGGFVPGWTQQLRSPISFAGLPCMPVIAAVKGPCPPGRRSRCDGLMAGKQVLRQVLRHEYLSYCTPAPGKWKTMLVPCHGIYEYEDRVQLARIKSNY